MMAIEEVKPFAYVCHKGNRFGGVCASAERIDSDDILEFLREFIENGYTITTVFNREQYLELYDKLNWDVAQPRDMTGGK